MMNILNIIIPGKPIAKQRSRKGSIKWYNPQEKEMQKTKRIIGSQLPEGFKMIPKKIPVKVSIIWFFEPTKAERTKKFLDLIKNEDFPYTKKPDRDNLDKYILDCFSGLIFFDDNQVYGCEIMNKYYTDKNSRTEVQIKWQE